MAIGHLLLNDCYYKKSYSTPYSYIFDEHGRFVKADKNLILDTIRDFVAFFIDGITPFAPVFESCSVYIDYAALNQALSKYSRDTNGARRFSAKINKIKHISKEDASSAISGLEEYGDYGFKISSKLPYIHRCIANLFYWFSLLKPFHISTEKNIEQYAKEYEYLFSFFNEFITYMLLNETAKSHHLQLVLHASEPLFIDVLYDLHFRNISRSSLEFFLNEYLRPC